MTDRELAIQYAPHLYFDKNEPFNLDRIGYSVFYKSQRSKSFERDIQLENGTAFVVEYQLYYDYDIQHMYDLEHVWIYVARDGSVLNAEASAHGSFLNCYRYNPVLEEDTHLRIFVQPGKHALFPDGKLFLLYSDYELVCSRLAGIDGLLVPAMFQGQIRKNSYIDYMVCTYIREHFSFEPSLEFDRRAYEETIIVTWEELYRQIPERINKRLEEMGL